MKIVFLVRGEVKIYKSSPPLPPTINSFIINNGIGVILYSDITICTVIYYLSTTFIIFGNMRFNCNTNMKVEIIMDVIYKT